MRHISLIIAVLALAIAAPAIAGKGGNGYRRERWRRQTQAAVAAMSRPLARVPWMATSSTEPGLPNMDADELHGHRLFGLDRLGHRVYG